MYDKMFSIILAAGRGTRMGDSHQAKVCLEINGEPVVTRSIDIYTRCGIANHIVVVGDRAEQVMATISARLPDVIFAYQREPLGTGHATRCGAVVLEAFGYDGEVFVVAGDKVLAERAVREQIELFRRCDADLCAMVGAREDFPDSGRIVEDEAGRILGNVEVSEIARARLIGHWFEAAQSGLLGRGRLVADMTDAFPTERKAQKAMPALWRLLEERSAFSHEDLNACFSPHEAFFEFAAPDGAALRLTAAEVETRARCANLCVFLFRMNALRYVLDRFSRANAQGEEYITDAIGLAAAARTPEGRPRFRVVAYPIRRRTDALAFNTLEELREIADHYRPDL